eukprot:gene10648-11776_t
MVLEFSSAPAAISYVNKEGSILLHWNFTGQNIFPFKEQWYKADAHGNQLGSFIMSKILSNPPEIFLNRVAYVPNGGMHVSNVSFSDEGYMAFLLMYRALSSASVRTQINMTYITVTIAPTLVTGLANESTAYKGAESIFQCAFDARPAPTIQWYLNGIAMNNARYNINATVSDGSIANTTRVLSKLTIYRSMPEDAGVISCIAMLPNANSPSQTNHVVLYEPVGTQFRTNKVNNVARLGQSIAFNCSFTEARPVIVYYQIFRDGTLVSNSTSGIFILDPVSLSQEGVYTCIPKNIIGNGLQKQINFTIHVPPALVSSVGSIVNVVLGSPFTLTCTFKGEPTPTLLWQKHNGVIPKAVSITTKILSQNTSFAVVQSTISFGTSNKSQHGQYECAANNSVGSLAQNISVNLQYAPNLHDTLDKNYTLVENSGWNKSWTCKAEGNPEVGIIWMLNGKQLPSGFNIGQKKMLSSSSNFETESTLTMIGINRKNAGSLTCNASNIIGYQQSTTTIVIQFQPEFVTTMAPISHIEQGTENHKIKCSAVGNPEPSISWPRSCPVKHEFIQSEKAKNKDMIYDMKEQPPIQGSANSAYETIAEHAV